MTRIVRQSRVRNGLGQFLSVGDAALRAPVLAERFSVRVSSRDFSGRPVALPVPLAPVRYSVAALGGPDRAELAAEEGSVVALASLAELLRCPIELLDDRGEAVWWGYVSGVRIRQEAIEIGLSLDEMANRVAVTYTDTHGARHVTGYLEEPESIATYGIKERRESAGSGITGTTAQARRDVLLAERQWPVQSLNTVAGLVGVASTVTCRGWWHTLGWTHWEQSAGTIEFADERATWIHVDGTATLKKVGQSFPGAGVAMQAHTIAVRLRKEGLPADSIRIALYSDAGGQPGVQLDSAEIAGADLSDGFAWRSVTLSDTATLSVGTLYWIVLERTGAADPANYFAWCTNDEERYPAGTLETFDGASWTPASGRDGLFRVEGVRAASDQVLDILDGVQFLAGRDIRTSNSSLLSPYRSGAGTRLEEMEELLALGGPSGRRLLATMTRDRILRIGEEPAASDALHILRPDGTLERPGGGRVPLHSCPVGLWLSLRDVVPHHTARLAHLSRAFLERSEYSARAGTWRPGTRGVASAWTR